MTYENTEMSVNLLVYCNWTCSDKPQHNAASVRRQQQQYDDLTYSNFQNIYNILLNCKNLLIAYDNFTQKLKLVYVYKERHWQRQRI